MKGKVNGSHKGSKFERTVCRKLSKWVTGSETPECFWRSAGSGAMATKDQKSSQTGDIIPVQHKHHMDQFSLTNHFIIECKNYNDFRFDFMIDSKYDKSNISVWWMKLMGQCIGDGKMPMLIVKKNRSPIYILMHNCVLRSLRRWKPYSVSRINFLANREMFITRLDNFFDAITYTAFIETVVKYDPFGLQFDEDFKVAEEDVNW